MCLFREWGSFKPFRMIPDSFHVSMFLPVYGVDIQPPVENIENMENKSQKHSRSIGPSTPNPPIKPQKRDPRPPTPPSRGCTYSRCDTM